MNMLSLAKDRLKKVVGNKNGKVKMFVKNCELVRISFENGLWGTWMTFRVPDRRLEGWGHL